MSVNGVGIRDIRGQSGPQSLVDDSFSVGFPPLGEDDDDFLVGFGERVRNAALRQDDDSAVYGGPEPENVCMPKKCAPLACDCEIVQIALP